VGLNREQLLAALVEAGEGLFADTVSCSCPNCSRTMFVLNKARWELAKKAALREGNRIEFVRIVREQLEAEAERDESVRRLNKSAIDLIKVLESGWEPVPEMDQATYAEEYLIPLHDKLHGAIMNLLVEVFSD
jgi:hypothetical protein